MTPLVAEIKTALVAAQSVAEIDALAAKHKDDIKAMNVEGGDMRVMVIQIKNLAALRRKQLGGAANA